MILMQRPRQDFSTPQDLLTRTFCKIFIPGPVRKPHKIVVEGPSVEDLTSFFQKYELLAASNKSFHTSKLNNYTAFSRSSCKARTSYKTSGGSLQDLLTRASTRSRLTKLKRHEVTRGLRKHINISTVPQRERSDTHRVTRWLREHTLEFHKVLCAALKNRKLKTWKAILFLGSMHFLVEVSKKYCACHEKWVWGIRSPKYCACHAKWWPSTKSKNDDNLTNKRLEPFEASPRFTKYCANDLRQQLSCWAAPATVLATCVK